MSEILRIRAPRATSWWLLPALLPLLVSIVDFWTHGPDERTPSTWWQPSLLVSLPGAALVVATVLMRPDGVYLTDDHLVVVSTFIPTRRIAWRDVQGVDVDGGGRVRVHRARGRPIRLMYPARRFPVPRARFEADYHRIGQWWLAHRGPDWRPVTPPPTTGPASGGSRTVDGIWGSPPESR